MKKLLGYIITAAVFLVIGLLLADTKVADVAKTAARSAKSAAIQAVGDAADAQTRTLVPAENPELLSRILERGSFGSEQSETASQNMFGRNCLRNVSTAISACVDRSRSS